MAWNDAYNMGSAFPLMDYGSNQLAKYGSNALFNPNDPYAGLSSGQQVFGDGIRGTGVGNQFANARQRMTSNDAYRGTFPGQRSPHTGFEEMQFDETVQAPERTGIMENFKNKLSGFTTPAMAFVKKMGGVTPEKKAAYDAITGGKSLAPGQWTRGMYGGNEYDLYNSRSGLKVGSDILGRGEGYEKNLYSAFGSKSLEEMEQNKLDWAMNRISKGKAISQRLRDILTARGLIGGNIGDQRPGKDPSIPIGPINTGGATTGGDSTYRGPPTTSFNRAQFARSGGQRPSTDAGHTDPGRGSYGPHRGSDDRAEGGRIGYQEGELVEDEYMAEATPGGMMEENVETVQGEPSREQLEVIALEIFRLPLEELNEEQLNVVYQAAMQQEPSEEEIQFAAQEGPGEGIASLV